MEQELRHLKLFENSNFYKGLKKGAIMNTVLVKPLYVITFIVVMIVLIAVESDTATIDVSVFNFDFSPDPIINVGDTIRWVWSGATPHTSTSVAGSVELWNSGIHTAPFTFTHTFSNVGTFAYYCTIHGADNGNGTASGMAGTITVVSPINAALVTQPSQGQLLAPIKLKNAGDGSNRLFIADQTGKVQIIKNGILLPTPFLDISSKLVTINPSYDERGLLGLAFHPDYNVPLAPGQGRFYVYYSAPAGGGTPENPIAHQSIVAEYLVSPGNPDVAEGTSERILMNINQPQSNHNGGELDFGSDGMLYIALGDGGGSDDNGPGHTGGSAAKPSGVLGNAQDKTRLLGKILRIDPLGNNSPNGQYAIPASNPFVGEGGGVREEIYAYGFRNPFSFSFDDRVGGTNDLYVADVGQNRFEEVDIVDSAGNYGWRIREGAHDFDPTVPNPGVPLIDPIAEYSHPGTGIGEELGITVIGGNVYRGNKFSELTGKYVFADWTGRLLVLDEAATNILAIHQLSVLGGNPIGLFITAIGEDESGEVYVVAKTTTGPGTDPAVTAGRVLQIVSPSTYVLPLKVEYNAATGFSKVTWQHVHHATYQVFWTDDISAAPLWDIVSGPALADIIDNGDGTRSFTDKGTDPEMAGQAPGNVGKRFYTVIAQ